MAEPNELSFNAVLSAMEPGKSVSITQLLTSEEVETGKLGEIKAKLRGRMNPAVTRARQRHADREFRSDCGQFVTDTGTVIVTVAVTRTE